MKRIIKLKSKSAMLRKSDYSLLKSKNISEETVIKQLASFEKGFPYANLQKPAVVNDGIVSLSESECKTYIALYEKMLSNGLEVSKFVPASGAATRMFKSLFEFLQATSEEQFQLIDKEPYSSFIKQLDQFAFTDQLKSITELDVSDQVKFCTQAISALLLENGLNYGGLPKGLLQFHKDSNRGITTFEEHLRETAKYCKNNSAQGIVQYTVSPEHHEKFTELLDKVIEEFEQLYDIKYDVSFSFQKPSTDTIAANPDNSPFRDENGLLLFRPGGHGALIENLNDMTSNLVFIKNIDNVVPDHLQADTVKYKKVIAGLLLEKKEKIFNILKKLDSIDDQWISDGIKDGLHFLAEELQLEVPDALKGHDQQQQINYIKERLNRPIRVCGMVKNEGEPGGGPFWVKQSDGSTSLQIVEGAQIDPDNEHQQEILKNSTHFNPVDLVCYLKDYKDQKFDLHQYIDPGTGFISEKTQNGLPLKALELPGLWNGAMANWITFFVEVPISTFNPVKTVMDLLRPQHQPE